MKKLNQKQIKHIVKESDKRDIGFWAIARIHGITERWVREVHKKYSAIPVHLLLTVI